MSKAVFWTEARIADLRMYAEQGMCSPEIAEKFGRTASAIRKQANKHDIAFHGEKNDWTEKEDLTLRAMVADGFGWKDIARDLPGRSQNSVTGYAYRNGIKFTGKRGPKPYLYAKPKEKPAARVKRKCLGPCEQYFESAWIGNRYCKSCASWAERQSGAMA